MGSSAFGMQGNFIHMTNISYYTEEGLQKLREKLEHLKSVERPAISKQIAEARDKGDLSENAEYDAAKDAQGMLEMEISKLEEVISTARIVDEANIDASKIAILSKVKLKNLKDGKEMAYTLVSETEANLKEGKISVTSPIGKGLLGKEQGQKVEIAVPSGILNFEILEISR